VRPYTLEEIIQPYQKYPKTIQDAILLAHTHPAFLALTKATRKVLYALLTRACQHDGRQPIKARIDRLALEAAVSDKTVQRAITLFREIGWLEHAERRSEYGLFCSRVYQFSPALCALVKLPLRRQEAETLPQETKMSDGAVYVDLTFKEDQHQISLKNRQGQPVDLPDALQRASDEFAIRPTGVAKLRGLARAAGHDLAHIVTVARQYLQRAGATGHRAYRYLERMAAQPAQLVDYAARALQVARLTAVQQQVSAANTIAQRCRNKRFVGPAGLVVRVFDTTAEVVQDGVYRTVPYADLHQIHALVEAGMLREAEPGVANAAPPARPMSVSGATAGNPAPGAEPRPASHRARLRAIVDLAKRGAVTAGARRVGPVPGTACPG
jgi:hypothetical protein